MFWDGEKVVISCLDLVCVLLLSIDKNIYCSVADFFTMYICFALVWEKKWWDESFMSSSVCVFFVKKDNICTFVSRFLVNELSFAWCLTSAFCATCARRGIMYIACILSGGLLTASLPLDANPSMSRGVGMGGK